MLRPLPSVHCCEKKLMEFSKEVCIGHNWEHNDNCFNGKKGHYGRGKRIQNKLYTRGLSEGGSVHLAKQVVNCFTKTFILACQNLRTTIGGQKILAP
jgi:hypothetical protein